MAAPKTVFLADLPGHAREVYQNVRASRPMSGPVARSGTDSSESTARFVTERVAGDEPSAAPLLEHAAPCTYHVSTPEQTEIVTPPEPASKMSRGEAANVRAVEAERFKREAERRMLRKDYRAALEAMQEALRYEGSARNEAFYAWVLHLCTAAVGGRVHPRAWQHIESALRRDPNSEHAHFYHAMLLKHAGRQDDAHQVFKRVTRINPNNQDAHREIRLWEMRTRPKGSPGFMTRVLGHKPE